jgi:hypothetical protein
VRKSDKADEHHAACNHVVLWVGHAARKCAQNFGGGNFLEDDHFTKRRRRWEDNIKMDLDGMHCEEGRWMKLREKTLIKTKLCLTE